MFIEKLTSCLTMYFWRINVRFEFVERKFQNAAAFFKRIQQDRDIVGSRDSSHRKQKVIPQREFRACMGIDHCFVDTQSYELKF